MIQQPDQQCCILIIQAFDSRLGRHRMGERLGFACKGDVLRSTYYICVLKVTRAERVLEDRLVLLQDNLLYILCMEALSGQNDISFRALQS